MLNLSLIVAVHEHFMHATGTVHKSVLIATSFFVTTQIPLFYNPLF